MPRSRLRSSAKRSEFDLDLDASLDSVVKMDVVQPKKKGRKKAKEISYDVASDLSSDEHVGQFVKLKKPKKSKKRVEVGAGEGERRTVLGTRRLVRQNAVDKSPEMLPKCKFTLPSPNLSLINKNVSTSGRKVPASSTLIASSPMMPIGNVPKASIVDNFKWSSSKLNLAFDLNSNLDMLGDISPATVNSTYEILETPEAEISSPPSRIKRKSVTFSENQEWKRNSYDIEPSKSFLLKERENKENTPFQSITAGSVQTKKLFSVNLHNEKVKMKISDSKSSLTDSGMSSASKLFRRAQQLCTPAAGNASMVTPKYSSTSITKKSTPLRSNSKVKKVPNYAAIHQKAYERMENIVAYEQRRKDRGQALLSGKKVAIGMKPVAKPTSTKKQLSFNSVGITPPPKRAAKAIKKSVDFAASSSPIKIAPARFPKTPKPTKSEVWAAYGTKIPKATAALFTLGSSAKKQPVVSKPSHNENKKLRLRDVESVSTKSKGSSQPLVEKRRVHVCGVRSNRRFDLLMNMRYGNAN